MPTYVPEVFDAGIGTVIVGVQEMMWFPVTAVVVTTAVDESIDIRVISVLKAVPPLLKKRPEE